jgi:uncharacterized protein (DUF305 family)
MSQDVAASRVDPGADDPARADADASEAVDRAAAAARVDPDAAGDRGSTPAADRTSEDAAPRAAGPEPADEPTGTDDAGPPPDAPPEDPDEGDPDGWGGEASWVRPFLVVGAVLGLLLLGGAGGLLIGLPSSNAPVVPTAGSVDVGFAQDMSVHHQQAVEMAGWERDHSTDPVLVQLASDIETTQNSQVGRMQGWLDLWGAAQLPLGGRYMAWMSEPTHDHGGGAAVTTMPGMASPADLAALRAATGQDLDVTWLQLMLRHHQGAIGMLQYAADHAAVPQLRNLAAQMLKAQNFEIGYLTQLLAERGGQPLPPP